MKSLIEKLKDLDLESEPVKEIEEIISGFGYLPVILTDYHEGKIIHRARCINKGDNIVNASQLSFTPTKLNTRYQRASTPEQTMFYGALIPEINIEGEISNERLIGACEASKFLRDYDAPDGEEIIVFGKWIVRNKISLLTIINPEIESNNINFFKKMTSKYHVFLETYPDKREDAELFQSFMSSEFAKSDIKGDFDYLITAKFTERIIEHYDGVVYPSVRAEFNGLCVAINPEIVNENLELIGVLECKISKLGNKVNIQNLRYANEVVNGEFELRDCH